MRTAWRRDLLHSRPHGLTADSHRACFLCRWSQVHLSKRSHMRDQTVSAMDAATWLGNGSKLLPTCSSWAIPLQSRGACVGGSNGDGEVAACH
ncbi:Os06g0647000 [Oryza sativa Japonica Group]|uniref:Os06g0647000 protein n=1 Tax=Oryza sativa subsp. japonica TaxID=39947 RepID=A0A0P0WZM1_ORYSJ|nr:hypothetical protein EE612_035671 [Oryza sativa]BAS98872.1 Os06g0647000 [Oryza sativa Japonica Group]